MWLERGGDGGVDETDRVVGGESVGGEDYEGGGDHGRVIESCENDQAEELTRVRDECDAGRRDALDIRLCQETVQVRPVSLPEPLPLTSSRMLEDQSFQSVVCWGPLGDCFVVKVPLLLCCPPSHSHSSRT